MPTGEPPLARLEAAELRYPDGTRALTGADLAVGLGELMAVVGPNGSGKSTLIRVLGGELAPTAGRRTLADALGGGRGSSGRRHVRCVTQDPVLDPEMTGADTLHLFATLQGMGAARRAGRTAAVLEQLALGEHAGRRVGTYSGGFRQRLHLAVALLDEPKLLLLDEPTGGLDAGSRAQVWSTLRRYPAQERALVVATHDLAEAERHADRVLVLRAGVIVADGSPGELRVRHARQRLVADLPAGSDGEELRASVGALDGTVEARIVAGRLVVYLDGASDKVLAHLAQSGAPPASFRGEAADLRSAYFRLTGDGDVSSGGPPHLPRRGGRGGGGGGGGGRRPRE